ncbi:hypothetical protein ABN764_08605 [Paenibacillaceae sp. P-4]|uniref:hypothetical protein n=1 Tax=Paenibacillaceae bacterium P-4 TaxID=3160969 RepID=UPI0032E84B9D
MFEITNWGNDPYLMGIAAICSVAGLVLSLVLIFITAKVNKTVNEKLRKRIDIENFNKKRGHHKDKFEFFQLMIEKDDIFKSDLILQLLNEIEELKNYNSLLSKGFKFQIWLMKRELNKDENKINKSRVAKRLSYFITKCKKEEGHFL